MGSIHELFAKLTSKINPGASERTRSATWSGALEKGILIKKCPFVVFDTELSGLDVRKDFIVSIGALKMTGGAIHIGTEFYKLVRPEGLMSKKSVEIHGIVPDELKNQERLDSVLTDFLDYIRNAVLVGHFIHIDLKFVNNALKKSRIDTLANPALDTSTIHDWLYENGKEFRRHYPGSVNRTDLFSIAQRYRMTIETMHNAVNDAFITAQLFQRFLPFLHAEGMDTLHDLLDAGRA